MLVRDVMTPGPVTVGPEETLYATARMNARGCRRLPVPAGERLVGILTDRDLRLAVNSPLILQDWRME